MAITAWDVCGGQNACSWQEGARDAAQHRTVPSAEGETWSSVNGGYHQNGSLGNPALPMTESNLG